MTEEQRAEHYDQARDDPRVWEEIEDAYHVPTRAVEGKGLTETVTVRFAQDDAARLREAARRLNLSYSDVVREAVRELLRPRFYVDADVLRNIRYDISSPVTRATPTRFRNPLESEMTHTGSSTDAPRYRQSA